MNIEREKTFNELKTQLTEKDIDEILTIVGYRCRVNTINKLGARLTYSPSTIPNYGILERLTKDSYGLWSYCAGQSYTDEIRTIREIFLKDYK